jgi:hypothetical protein
VLQREHITAEPAIILGYADRYPDLRQMLMTAQRVYLAKRHLAAIQVAEAADGVAMLSRLEAKDWAGLRRAATGDGFDPGQALRELFWAIPDDHPRAGFLRHVVGRGVHETGFTPDPQILFLGVCAEAIEGL